MINLEEYKNALVNTYMYEIDNSDKMREERRIHLKQHYSDEYLSKIIDDTYIVIRKIFDICENGYCNINMNDDTTFYISLNLCGGYFSDRLYIDSDGYFISEYILKNVFGKTLSVEVKDTEYELDMDDSDIMSFGYDYSLYLKGFPDNMDNIKSDIFGISKNYKIGDF